MKSLLAIVVAILMGFTVFLVITPAVAAPNDNASNKGPPELEKIVFIHYYKPNHASDSDCNAACEGNDNNKTFRLVNGGIKWANLPIDYLINTNQFSGAEEDAIKDSADTWDDALDEMSASPINLFADSPSSTTKTQTNAGDNDGENIIVKGDLASNIIGVTSFWYNPGTKEVVDADMVLNFVDFDWSTNAPGTSLKMDVQNIVTHELGHFLVLDDLSSPKTFDLTMYGFSDTGEIKSRTTGFGDELGVAELYASSDGGVDDGEDGPDCTKSKSKKWC